MTTCSTCPSFEPGTKGYGECRYAPPTVLKDEQRGRFPRVSPTDWCRNHPERTPEPVPLVGCTHQCPPEPSPVKKSRGKVRTVEAA